MPKITSKYEKINGQSNDCKKCYKECLSSNKSQIDLIEKCKFCPLFTEKMKIVNRLDYEMFEKERDERIEIRKKKGDAWNNYKYLKGFFEFLKREDRASISDLEREYRSVLEVQKEIGIGR